MSFPRRCRGFFRYCAKFDQFDLFSLLVMSLHDLFRPELPRNFPWNLPQYPWRDESTPGSHLKTSTPSADQDQEAYTHPVLALLLQLDCSNP